MPGYFPALYEVISCHLITEMKINSDLEPTTDATEVERRLNRSDSIVEPPVPTAQEQRQRLLKERLAIHTEFINQVRGRIDSDLVISFCCSVPPNKDICLSMRILHSSMATSKSKK